MTVEFCCYISVFKDQGVVKYYPSYHTEHICGQKVFQHLQGETLSSSHISKVFVVTIVRRLFHVIVVKSCLTIFHTLSLVSTLHLEDFEEGSVLSKTQQHDHNEMSWQDDV